MGATSSSVCVITSLGARMLHKEGCCRFGAQPLIGPLHGHESVILRPFLGLPGLFRHQSGTLPLSVITTPELGSNALGLCVARSRQCKPRAWRGFFCGLQRFRVNRTATGTEPIA